MARKPRKAISEDGELVTAEVPASVEPAAPVNDEMAQAVLNVVTAKVASPTGIRVTRAELARAIKYHEDAVTNAIRDCHCMGDGALLTLHKTLAVLRSIEPVD